jgi:hypothetical protein
MTWQLPDTYHSAGHGRGTATLEFYEGRDILINARKRTISLIVKMQRTHVSGCLRGKPILSCPTVASRSALFLAGRGRVLWAQITSNSYAGLLLDCAAHQAASSTLASLASR